MNEPDNSVAFPGRAHGVGETFYQVPCTGVNHDTPPPSREKGEGEK